MPCLSEVSKVAFNGLGNSVNVTMIGAIPKDDSAYTILQAPQYENMGDINWSTGETWGILFSGVVVGLAAMVLFNRYYK
jgi:hypothetical protein